MSRKTKQQRREEEIDRLAAMLENAPEGSRFTFQVVNGQVTNARFVPIAVDQDDEREE